MNFLAFSKPLSRLDFRRIREVEKMATNERVLLRYMCAAFGGVLLFPFACVAIVLFGGLTSSIFSPDDGSVSESAAFLGVKIIGCSFAFAVPGTMMIVVANRK